ncbi:MAG: class II aldolase/adducin family protein, partial [bacterium]|nr:class II aldolase/adducin family protein [bacterium]
MGCGNHNPEEKVADICREAGMAIAEKFGLEEARRVLPVIAEILLKHGRTGHGSCSGNCSHGGGCSCGKGNSAAVAGTGDAGIFAPGSPELATAEELVRTGKILADLGFMAGCAGNLSMRLPNGNVMVSPAGVRKGDMKPEQMVIMSLDGKVISGGKPSSEYK